MGETPNQDRDARQITRQEFLKVGLASGAAFAVGGGGYAASASAARARAHEAAAGTLRVGITGGGSSETLDPNLGTNTIDVARSQNLYEGLLQLNDSGAIQKLLASEVSANKAATVWTIVLQPNVKFHDGHTLSADDVIYTLNYWLNPANKSRNGAPLMPYLAPSGIQRVDALTVRLNLTAPNSMLNTVLADKAMKIFANGMTTTQLASAPNGTGPFKFVSWTQGERSLFDAFADYHGGAPRLGALEFISISTPAARVDAIIADQVDAIAEIDPTLLSTLKSNSSVKLLERESAAFVSQYMDIKKAPFGDPRVRQAFRLLANRPQLVSNALDAQGRLGNDLQAWFDPDYLVEPQRVYDPEKAKSLLKAAGHSKLSVTLETADAAPGMVQSSELFAQQAAAGGVKVALKTWPSAEYYGASGPWMNSAFACTNYVGSNLLFFVNDCFSPKGVFNETSWDNPTYNQLIASAYRTTDNARRRTYLQDAQKLLFDEGGYIIWGFSNNLDAVRSNVKGVQTSVLRPLGDFHFQNVSLA